MITLGNLLRFHRLIELYLRATHHEPDTQPSTELTNHSPKHPMSRGHSGLLGSSCANRKAQASCRCYNSPRLTLTATDLLRMTQHKQILQIITKHKRRMHDKTARSTRISVNPQNKAMCIGTTLWCPELLGSAHKHCNS